jgi:hypothetical protein
LVKKIFGEIKMSNKLFVVKRHYDYEGYDVIGIFNNEEMANNIYDNMKYRGDGMSVDSYILNEVEVCKLNELNDN